MVHRTTQDYTGLKGTSRRGYRIYRVVTPRGIEPLFSGRKPEKGPAINTVTEFCDHNVTILLTV